MLLKRVLISLCKKKSLASKLSGQKSYAENAPLVQAASSRNYSSFDVKDEQTSSVSLYNIKRAIKASGFEFSEGFTSVKTSCPICDYGEPSTGPKKDIYVNKTTGNFTCSSCQHLGRWDYIEKFFLPQNKSPKTISEMKKLKDLFLETKTKINLELSIPDNLVPLSCLNDEEILKILEYFQIENIPPSSLLHLKPKWDKDEREIYVPLLDVEDRVVGYKILSKTKEGVLEKTIPENNTAGLVYAKTAFSTKIPSKEAVLVLNVLDLLALSVQKINATIICLPYDLKSLPQQCLPGIDKFQKLTLWFNYDTAGWDIARNYAKKLEDKRCFFVRPTDSHPTPYKALYQHLDLKSIFTKAQPILHKAITTFQSLRQDVLSDLQNIDKVQGVKWKRYPTLNKLLKGHRKGELTVLTGPTGCGKTTFMSDYSLDLALQGVSTLWGSFEIRNTRLASTLLRQLAGKPLDINISEFDHFADEFERLPIYFMTFHGQQPIKVVMDAIEHAQYVHDIHHVIIDNVQFMMGLTDEPKHLDRFWKQDAIIASFRTFATKKNCHVTLVIHPRKEREADDLTTSSIFGGAKASQEADNVLIIQDKRLTSIRGKKYLQIAKNRYSGDLGIMPLEFDKQSLSYSQKKRKEPEKELLAIAAVNS